MQTKLLGGILLIIGTTIGAGMLALPIVTVEAGFLGASILCIISWVIMTLSAFLVLEANLWFPLNSNIILMAKSTLGRWGEAVAWICYLALFYCLLAAYVSGGSDILHGLMNALGIHLSARLDAVLFVLILGGIVYKGIRAIDYANRGLMFIKMLTLGLLVLFTIPYVDVSRYSAGELKYMIPAITVVVTSFGFSNIVPSLRCYFNSDVKQLRKVILWGSLIPLICYLLWIGVIFGSIPFQGKYSLMSLVKSDHSTLALTQSLIYYLNNSWITSVTRIFTSVCVATSFLGVALCVVDFLADGFGLEKSGLNNIFLHLLTFLPPLAIALFYPNAFILGLNYAGVTLAILLLLLPALMVWSGRYRKKIVAEYQVIGGKLPLILISLAAFCVIIQGLFWRG